MFFRPMSVLRLIVWAEIGLLSPGAAFHAEVFAGELSIPAWVGESRAAARMASARKVCAQHRLGLHSIYYNDCIKTMIN
jgi:hypothetical protein